MHRVVDDGPAPSDDAKRLGPAHAWQDGKDWVLAQYRADAPLNAVKAQRFDSEGEVVLRVGGVQGSKLVRAGKRALRGAGGTHVTPSC